MKKILIPTILLLLISGCINYTQDVHLYTDGSGKMKIDYWMKLPDNESFVVLDKIGIFNADSIRKEFSSEYTRIENVEVYTDSVDSTTHALIEFSFEQIDSLNQVKVFSEADFQFKDGAAGQKIFSQFIPPIATGFGVDGSEFRVSYHYVFSGEIIQHNAIEVNDRTLIWDYTLDEIGSGKTISVTFRPFKLKETPYWIYILSGLVLLIVIVFLFRKKKD